MQVHLTVPNIFLQLQISTPQRSLSRQHSLRIDICEFSDFQITKRLSSSVLQIISTNITSSTHTNSTRMASDTVAPVPTSKWADNEKIALLVSVIKTFGVKVKWADVSVPAGRTTQSSAKMYSEMLKASASVPMTRGAAIVPSKKRGRKKDEDGATASTEKRKRVRKSKNAARSASLSPNEDDEEALDEKVKVESKDEDEEDDGI